jgi:soluble lytic murein transglycosylase-like protein
MTASSISLGRDRLRPSSQVVVLSAVLMAGTVLGSGVTSFGPRALAAIRAQVPTSSTGVSAQFAARARGVTIAPAPLRSGPVNGAVIARLAPGSPLDVAGRVRLWAGITPVDLLWVATDLDGAPLYGFIPSAAVALAGIQAPYLELDGIVLESLAAPVTWTAETGPAFGQAGADAADSRDASRAPLLPGTASATDALAPAGTVAIPWLPSTLSPWLPEIMSAAATHGLDPELVAIVALVESGGNPRAVSGSGAAGLMQVMPMTAEDIVRRRGLGAAAAQRLFDATINIDLGAWYLAEQLRSFGVPGDADWSRSVERAAAAYNGGPGTARRWVNGASLPAETSRYVRWVGGMWRERHQAASATFDAWMAAGGAKLVAAAAASQASVSPGLAD